VERGPSAGGQAAGEGGRSRLPRRLGDVLGGSIERLARGDQARAYGAWSRAAGRQVLAAAQPRAFSRGKLTVECTSSVWANELTYLGGQILRRMDEVAPGHPVKGFRFVIARGPAEQEDPPSAAKKKSRRQRPAPLDLERARAQAEGVRDDRLRAAILAALGDVYEEPPEAPVDGTRDG
jgi:hypothetical protein